MCTDGEDTFTFKRGRLLEKILWTFLLSYIFIKLNIQIEFCCNYFCWFYWINWILWPYEYSCINTTPTPKYLSPLFYLLLHADAWLECCSPMNIFIYDKSSPFSSFIIIKPSVDFKLEIKVVPITQKCSCLCHV